MVAATAMPCRISSHSNRSSLSDQIRLRALERLYERREVVNELISCMEQYQERQYPERREPERAHCIEITAVAK
jgi:predicted site-specific integrase-resolvase